MKKNIWKLLGIIALVAVIGFGLAGCVFGSPDTDTDTDNNTPSGDDQELSGTIFISNSQVTDGTAITTRWPGYLIFAVYTGDETWLDYQWEKDGTAISDAPYSEYLPTEAGSYTVTVSKEGYQSKTSAAVTVGLPATATATVSVGVNAVNSYSYSPDGFYHSGVIVTLTLSDGVWNLGTSAYGQLLDGPFDDTIGSAFKEAVTVAGITWPDGWRNTYGSVEVNADLYNGGDGRTATFYGKASSRNNYPQSSGTITVTLDPDKLAALKQYTTVSGSLTAGTTTASDGDWTQ
jgi:hypothetical protein